MHDIFLTEPVEYQNMDILIDGRILEMQLQMHYLNLTEPVGWWEC
jgi:hypothetical protein